MQHVLKILTTKVVLRTNCKKWQRETHCQGNTQATKQNVCVYVGVRLCGACGCGWQWKGEGRQQQQQPNSCENLKPQFTHFVSLRGFISLTSKSIWLGLNFLRRFWQLFDASFATDRETDRQKETKGQRETEQTEPSDQTKQLTNLKPSSCQLQLQVAAKLFKRLICTQCEWRVCARVCLSVCVRG